MAWHGGFSGLGFTRAEFRKWLAAQAKPTYPKFLVVHNTAAPYIVPSVPASTRIKNLGNYYQNDVKWSSGPNLIVIKDKVYGGTPLQFPGTNSPGFNGKSIGVECEGDYRQGKHDPLKGDGKIAWDTMAWVFAELCEWFGWPIDGDHIKLHREDPKTTHACPGNLVGKDWFLAKVKAASAVPQAPLPQPTAPTPTRVTVKKGSTGGDVTVLQAALKTLGFYKAAVDGDFGPKTDQAVKDFQKAQNLVVDGIVGPRTWGALTTATQKPGEAPKPSEPNPPKPPVKPIPEPTSQAEQRVNASGLHMSSKGLDLLKHFEGLRLEPYDDRGSLAIGYGHSNRSQKPPIVTPELRITADEALKILASDLVDYENRVKTSVKVPLFQGEFDALTSLAYNWGPGNLDRSELMKKLNAGDYKGAGEAIRDILPRADQPHYKGIKRRREEEYKLFVS